MNQSSLINDHVQRVPVSKAPLGPVRWKAAVEANNSTSARRWFSVVLTFSADESTSLSICSRQCISLRILEMIIRWSLRWVILLFVMDPWKSDRHETFLSVLPVFPNSLEESVLTKKKQRIASMLVPRIIQYSDAKVFFFFFSVVPYENLSRVDPSNYNRFQGAWHLVLGHCRNIALMGWSHWSCPLRRLWRLNSFVDWVLKSGSNMSIEVEFWMVSIDFGGFWSQWLQLVNAGVPV